MSSVLFRRVVLLLIGVFGVTAMVIVITLTGCAEPPQKSVLTHGDFEAFSKGHFDNGGVNLYVNAHGVISTIHRWDVNHDGHTDIIFVNSEAHSERGPTRVFQVTSSPKTLPATRSARIRPVAVAGSAF